MDYDVYTNRDLQIVSVILSQATKHGMTNINDLLEGVKTYLDNAFEYLPVEPSPRRKARGEKITPEKCPSCEKPTYFLTAPLEGLKRMGCRSCGYSQIIE